MCIRDSINDDNIGNKKINDDNDYYNSNNNIGNVSEEYSQSNSDLVISLDKRGRDNDNGNNITYPRKLPRSVSILFNRNLSLIIITIRTLPTVQTANSSPKGILL